MSTCQIMMSTCQKMMSTCQIFKLTSLIYYIDLSDNFVVIWLLSVNGQEYEFKILQRHYFKNVFLYSFIHFWLGTQKSNTNLNKRFTWVLNLTTCWVKLTIFYIKGEFNLTISAEYHLSFIHATSRNNVTKWLHM